MRISDWSSDVCSSDLEAEWSDDPNVPDEVHERIAAIDVEIGALVERPLTFDAQEMARAGVFVSIEVDGSLCIERGYVRPEDETVIASEDGEADAVCSSGEHKAKLQALLRITYAGL